MDFELYLGALLNVLQPYNLAVVFAGALGGYWSVRSPV